MGASGSETVEAESPKKKPVAEDSDEDYNDEV